MARSPINPSDLLCPDCLANRWVSRLQPAIWDFGYACDIHGFVLGHMDIEEALQDA